jgi:hypothetical protein
MKIVDIKKVENGYWKLTADFADTNIFKESSKNIILYYRNKEILIEVINKQREYFIIALADLIVDDMNNRVLKSRYFNCDRVPPLSELAFAYTINYINNNGALEE